MIGQKLADRYEVTAELGRGGMGVVYRAHDPRLNREVAVKLVPPDLLSSEMEQRFQREAQLVAQMDHPGIVSIFDFGRHQGSLFFVMPIVQGTNLRAFLRERSLLGEILDVGVQVAEALEYSHARGVVHRDIKPENIMVVREEPGIVRVRVMDFGLARSAAESRITKTGALVGTLGYLSPEQILGRTVDARSDVYALGTILYECVVGEPPFSGEVQSLLYRIAHELPSSPRQLGAAIDEEFESIILPCLAKEPDKRPQRAGEMAEALRRYRSRLRDSDRARSLSGLTRTMQAQRPAGAPFVGRGKDFAELQQRLNAAVAGECQLVVVAGEPGIGKTRLLDELENLARARKLRVLHGRSVEQDRSFPYQGFCEVIQEYFRLKETGSGPRPDLSDLAPDLVSLFPVLTEISEIRSAATSDSKVSRTGEAQGPENRTQIFELLARTMTRIAGGHPLVLFLEDLHLAEVSIEALQYIVRRLGPTPTLIVGTYRTTEVDARHPLVRALESFRGDRRFLSLTLGPLSPSEYRSFLETLVGGAPLAEDLARRLFEGSEGNPYFTKELVRSLLDSGGIARDDTGIWSLSGEVGLSEDALPATIQQAVEKRIERLPDELRNVLSVASVMGKTFDARDLEVLAEGKGVEDALDRLVEQGLVEEAREGRGEILAFSSGVVRDVLYAGVTRRKRRSLHRRYAELLEARHKGRIDRVLPSLVHHFSQGDVAEKSVEYALRLARASLDAFSAEEAVRSAKTVLEFLDDEWEGERALEGDARTLLARGHRLAGDIEGALREATAAVRAFEKEKQGGRAVAALVLGAEMAWQLRRTEETGRWLERGLIESRAAHETDSLRQLLSLAATLANLFGEYEKANAYLEEAARLAPAAREAEAEAALPRGGHLVVALPNPVSTLEPANIATNEDTEVASTLFEALLATDAQGNLVPWLCDKWEVADGGKRFLLTLRRGARFSDGTPLTAREVKASFETSIRRGSREIPSAFAAIEGFAGFKAGSAPELAGLRVRGEDTIEIALREPLPIYPALLSERSTGVVRWPGSDTDGFIGTGPFRLVSQTPERVLLERNPEYWRGAPPLDGIEFRTGLSASTMARAFRSGEIDLARDLLPQDLEDILRDPRFRRGLVEVPKKSTYFVLFNSVSGPLARSTAVRQALSGFVRTADLVWRTLGRFAQPATGLIPPGMLGYDAGRRSRVLSREEAALKLAAAGVSLPAGLRASVHPLVQDRYGALLETLRSTWAELGVQVEVATPDIKSFLASWDRTDGLDLLIGRWNADYDDPDNFTHTLFHSSNGQLRDWFSSPESDHLLEEARTEARPALREALYRKYESQLLDSAVLLPLFHDIDYRIAGPKVRGLVLRGSPPYVNYPELGKVEAPEAVAEARVSGSGILHVPMGGVVMNLDPAVESTTVEHGEVASSFFETLTHDMGGARIGPWLAAEFAAEDGGRRYRFRLRDDVRFHDGRRLTARDVRYSFERLLLTGLSDVRWLYAPIRGARRLLAGGARDLAGLTIESATEFTIDLEEPYSLLPAVLAFEGASIIPEGSDPSARSWQEGCVGTGPYRVAAFEPGRRLELEANRTYWRKGYPRNDGLVFTFGVPPKDILAGFREGRYAIASDLVPGDVETLLREPEFAAGYREMPRLVTYYAAFNRHRGPLTDPRLRQRLMRAVDVPRLVRQTLGRVATPAQCFIAPGLLGHDPSVRARLDSPPESADPIGPLELTAAANPVYFGGYAAVGRELLAAFAEKGFKVRVVNKTMAEWIEAATRGSVDVVVGRWAADFPDADTFAHILHSQEGYIGRVVGSPEIDRLVARGREETSPNARHSIYRQLEETVARDAVMIPLFHEQAYRFARPEIEGLTVGFWGQTVAYEALRIRT